MAQATGDKTLPSEVIQQIVTKTDGVPLFVELDENGAGVSMVRAVGMSEEERAGRPSRALLPLADPATLHDSLMARRDRLALAKEAANWARRWGGRLPMSCCRPSRCGTRGRCGRR